MGQQVNNFEQGICRVNTFFLVQIIRPES